MPITASRGLGLSTLMPRNARDQLGRIDLDGLLGGKREHVGQAMRRDVRLAPHSDPRAVATQLRGDGLNAAQAVDKGCVVHTDSNRAVSALKQERCSLSTGAPSACLHAPMAKRSDRSPQAAQIQDAQGERLTRLRRHLRLTQEEAATLAGVSIHTWKRMEQGKSDMSSVALARFSAATKMPAEYVVTGGFAGMDPDLVRDLVQVEAQEQLGGGESKPLRAGLAPRGRKRRKSSLSRPIEAMPATEK